MQQSFDNAQETGVPAGAKKILPLQNGGELWTDLFCRMPSGLRTVDSRQADYALITKADYESRSDYTGPAYNTITKAYLCGRNGTVYFVGSVTHSPPFSGTVRLGSALRGEIATAEEIWNAVKREIAFP